jgi:hypothetical protein
LVIGGDFAVQTTVTVSPGVRERPPLAIRGGRERL